VSEECYNNNLKEMAECRPVKTLGSLVKDRDYKGAEEFLRGQIERVKKNELGSTLCLYKLD
jgi:hypothetical protein